MQHELRVNHLSATRNHMPFGITQCYLPVFLPLGSGDFPTPARAEAGTRFSDPRGIQGLVVLGGIMMSSGQTCHVPIKLRKIYI